MGILIMLQSVSFFSLNKFGINTDLIDFQGCCILILSYLPTNNSFHFFEVFIVKLIFKNFFDSI